jgi:diphthine-ammonia ligase
LKAGVLFSGGKDSAYALHLAMQREEPVCLITVVSENRESYMFHTPNIGVTSLQAQAIGLPHVRVETAGEKERELIDLSKAIVEAKRDHGIEAVVTGAIESVYQAERVQRICDRLGLWCFNPLWKKDQLALLHELVDGGFEVLVSGVFAYPLDETWLGRTLGDREIQELAALAEKFRISPSGEGGEIETTVLDAPFFKKRVKIAEGSREWQGDSGVYRIAKAHLEAK